MMSSSRAVPTTRQEDMRHPLTAYADPSFADVPLDELRVDWLAHLRSRTPRVSRETIVKYDSVLRLFIASLARRPTPQPPVLSSVLKANVDGWVDDQRAEGLSDHTIHSRISALKAFSGKYLYRDMEHTTVDLLRQVRNKLPPDKPKTGLTETERETVLGCFTDPTYHDVRDRAVMAVCFATGMRFWEVMDLPLSAFDRLHGEIVVVGKGSKTRTARLSQRALKYVRQYLTERPRTDSDKLWLTEYGQPMTYSGAYNIMRRVRKKSGVTRLTWHLMRHGFAQHALQNGAHQGLVQEMLGHSTAAMTRKYLGHVKQQEAARQMPQYAPI